MFVKKQSASSKAASAVQMLPRNGRSKLLFQPHFAPYLAAPNKGSVSASSSSSGSNCYWLSTDVATACQLQLQTPSSTSDTETTAIAINKVQLPLPQYYLKNETLMKENAVPRELYSLSSFELAPVKVEESSKVAAEGTTAPIQQQEAPSVTSIIDKYTPSVPWPRCGRTGLFFQREEVVDNLFYAASVLGYTANPFWVHSDHPDLHGYLELKSGQDPLLLSLTARVYTLRDHELLYRWMEKNSASSSSGSVAKLLHPKFLDSTSRVPGTNLFTGTVCHNTYIVNGGSSSGAQHLSSSWFTLQQLCSQLKFAVNNKETEDEVRRYVEGLIAEATTAAPAPATTTATTSSSPSSSSAIIEVDQWELYNAEQLVVPGRLALERNVHDPDQLFR